MFPDVLFDWVFLKLEGKPWFAKKRLLKVLDGVVPHTDSSLRSFHSASLLVRKPGKFDKPFTELSRMIEQHGVVYVKPTEGIFVHNGWGIIKLEKTPEGLVMSSTASRSDEVMNVIIQFPSNSYKIIAGGKLLFPARTKEERRRQLARLASHNLYGNLAIERGLQIPKIDGKVWEIRTVVQSPNKEPEVVGPYAKLGSNELASNVSLGGHGLEAVKVISQVYSGMYPHKSPVEIGQLVQEFFTRANKIAVDATRAVNDDMKSTGKKLVPKFPERELYVRQAAVDITAEINTRTGKLDPFVMEYQYPDFAYSQFESSDPLGYRRFRHNEEKMVKQGRKTLKQFFNL